MVKLPLNKAMKDVQWAFISIATASLAHFMLRIILSKEFGPEGLGLYTLAFIIYLFGMQFAAFGIGSALTKYVAQFIDDQITIRNYVSSGMTSSIISGTIMGTVLFLFAPFISISFFNVPELASLLKLIAICYPFIAIQKAVLGTLNGFRKMHLFALLEIILNIAIVCISVILVLLCRMGVMGAIVGFVAPTVVIGILCPLLIYDSIGLDHSLWDKPALYATTVFGFYVVLGNSIGFLNTQVDSIMLGYYLNPTEVGIYAVAVLIAQTLTLLPSAVQRVTGPSITTLYGKGDIQKIRGIMISTMKKIFFISAALALFIVFTGHYFIAFLFDSEFLPAFRPLLILLLGQVFFSPFMAVGTTLASIGKVHISFRIAAVCAVINLGLNIIFIPLFGIVGAAIATTGAQIGTLVISMVVINKLLA